MDLAEFKAALDAQNAAIQAAIQAEKAEREALELKINRLGLGAGIGHGPTEAERLERKAFEALIRRGPQALTPDEVKVLKVSSDPDGGYLAPDSFVPDIQKNVTLFSPIRQIARVMPIGTGAATLPRRTGGMTAAWVGEVEARSETGVTWGMNTYPVRELAAYVDVSNQMLDDAAVDVVAELGFEFGEEFGRAEGAAFVNGSTNAQPAGFMEDTTIGYTATGNASAFPSSNPADVLIDAFHALKAPYRANAVWLMNTTTLGVLRKFKDGTGNYLLQVAGIANTPVTTLMGRPVIEATDMPDIGTNAYPIIFGDFLQGYRIFDRIPLSILRDPFTQAANGKTRFHGRRRVAGGVNKTEALRKIKCATS
jgi:HK97 family phage major capsid protein